jgi:hypothetical protein
MRLLPEKVKLTAQNKGGIDAPDAATFIDKRAEFREL